MAITFKKLSGDTEVIANPTLDGTETALFGLQIDGTKYAMPSGGSSGGSSGGTPQWVLKESVYLASNKSKSTTGDYANKTIAIATPNVAFVVPMIVNFNAYPLSYTKSDSENYIVASITGSGILTIKNKTTSTMTFKIYELEVA